MNKEQLSIAKSIAEIEGHELVYSNNGGWYTVGTPYENDDFEYNPFDWSILGPLMVKYEVEPNYDDSTITIFAGFAFYHADFLDESDIPRAILECIIKSKEK